MSRDGGARLRPAPQMSRPVMQGGESADAEAAQAPAAACSPSPHAMPQGPPSAVPREHGGREQGFKFWVSRLPSLPGEGALTADPYSKVGSSVQRSPSTPPAKPPV